MIKAKYNIGDTIYWQNYDDSISGGIIIKINEPEMLRDVYDNYFESISYEVKYLDEEFAKGIIQDYEILDENNPDLQNYINTPQSNFNKEFQKYWNEYQYKLENQVSDKFEENILKSIAKHFYELGLNHK